MLGRRHSGNVCTITVRGMIMMMLSLVYRARLQRSALVCILCVHSEHPTVRVQRPSVSRLLTLVLFFLVPCSSRPVASRARS
jgi:hypothetical protein